MTEEHVGKLMKALDDVDVPKEGRVISVSKQTVLAMAHVGTPLERARYISEMAFRQTGFRPRYVMIDGVTVDTQKDASIPIQRLFPGLGTKARRRR